MNLKNIYFPWLIYWGKMKGLLNGIAEATIPLASLASFFVLIYQFGFIQTSGSVHILERFRPFILLAFFTDITPRYVMRLQKIIQEKVLYLDISIYFLLFVILFSKIFFKDAIARFLPYLSFFTKPLLVYVSLSLLSTIHLSRQTFMLTQIRIKPSLSFLLSFVSVISVGAGLLSLPNATTHWAPFINALFISIISVCVAGLATVGVATCFTHAGYIIILILIQIGGIGVMTFTSFFALSFMGKSSFTSKMMLKDMLNEDRTGGLFRVILSIPFVTLSIEGIGTYFIYMDVRKSLSGGTQQELFYAMFHTVSVFCNAGISTLSGNTYDPLVTDKYNLHLRIAMLIIFGGLGSPIVFNYLKLLHHLLMNGIKISTDKQKHCIRTPRITNVHAYIVIMSALILLITGTALYFFFEHDNILGDLPLWEKLTNAFLGAVAPRMAGFNVADTVTLVPPTLMLTLILMITGAVPMFTSDGLKVTTVFVALVTTLNAAREKDRVEARKREIVPFVTRRAFAITMIYFMRVAIATWVLSYMEKGASLLFPLFEVVSALSTVGLSIDYAPHLIPTGKIIIISTMLAGRIGVLASFVSLCKEYTKKDYTCPQENILT